MMAKIAKAQFEAGFDEQACETIRLQPFSKSMDKLLGKNVQKQLSARNCDRAIELSNLIHDPNLKVASLNEVAKAQHGFGSHAEANRTFQSAIEYITSLPESVPYVYYKKDTCLSKVALAQFEAGFDEEVVATVELIQNYLSKISCFGKIANQFKKTRALTAQG
jgi:hypothetical protein